MSLPGKYRGLIVVVVLALVLGLADKAFSYRVANYAVSVVSDLIAEVAEVTAPQPQSLRTAIAPARAVWNGPRFEFPSAAEYPSAFNAFAYGDQPWIALGTPLVLDLNDAPAHDRPGPISTVAAFQSRGADQRSVPGQSMAGGGGAGSGGSSSGGGVDNLISSAADAIQGPQVEATDAETPAADLAAAAFGAPETSLAAALWSELAGGGTSGEPGSSSSYGEGASDPNHTGDDVGAFENTQNGPASPSDLPVSPSDLIVPSSLSEALALDSATGGANGSGLDMPAVLEVAAVLDVPGATASDLGLGWLHDLGSEGGLGLTEESPRQESLTVLAEPTTMAVFGMGLLALAGRLRSKIRRARS